MLYQFLYSYHVSHPFFNVFRYITFRTIYAILTALLISFVVGPWVIEKLRAFQIRQVVREDVPGGIGRRTEPPRWVEASSSPHSSSRPFYGPT